MIDQYFGRSIRITRELINLTGLERQEAAEAISRAIDARIFNTFAAAAMPNPGGIPSMTVYEVPSETLTIDSMRRAIADVFRLPTSMLRGRSLPTADEVRLRRAQAQYLPQDDEGYTVMAHRSIQGRRVKLPCRIASHGMSYNVNSGMRVGHAMACVKGDDATITWDSAAMQRGEKWERRKR